MLYVFIVSSGCMVKFDMNLAVKKVLELKTEIAKSLLIPVEEQVLLCSGGEELKLDNIVGNYYGAGTDTNPIFLFSKYSNEAEITGNIPPKMPIDLSIEDDVHNCANMAPSSNTAAVRATLAQRFLEAAVTGRRECDELVHGQHLQQQGWAAVIANLDDAKEALLKRKHHFEELYEKYMDNRSCYQQIIQTFPSDVELLSRVPLLPKLVLGSDEELAAEHTLLSWFCSEPLSVLQSLTEKYQRSLDELDEGTLSTLEEDVSAVLQKTDNLDIKEVRGIEERLSSLNRQIEDARKIEKDQKDLASWFSTTQGRMSRDPLVLPDLCVTFQKQLLLMLENHRSLRDILERCTRAKNELSHNINYRIKFIVRVESEMYELQVRIIFLEKHVLSVMKQYQSFHQVHLAPTRYLRLLAEVCRRRTFSSAFMKWATELSAQAFKLYSKEMSIRKSFLGNDSKNMVDNLFPGMDDAPPPFAIECPQPFDQSLPNIMREDLNILRMRVPELAHLCEVLPAEPMPYISQTESDSAISSTIPSSRNIEDSASRRGPISPYALAAPSGDCSSLPSEYASMPNEVFSLTSSPFEDPLLPSNNIELTPKRTNTHNLEHSVDKTQLSPLQDESDGEEFETVDRFGPTVALEIGHPVIERKRSLSAPRPNSTPEAINVNKTGGEICPKLSKARSDGDTVSPIQERLKHSDSLLVSTDFQSTEYYIDDSMPSSYTESNATSPLLRGNKMFKSHHMVVAELQKQVEEKNCAFACTVRFVRELQSSLQSDLSNLRCHVTDELGESSAEVARLTDSINRTLAHLQEQMLEERENVESMYQRRLEVECQKLSDAETQIVNYEEHLQQLSVHWEEVKQENQQLEQELGKREELIRSMILEHELELDSIKQELQHKEEENSSLKQALAQMRLEAEEEANRHLKEISHLKKTEAEKLQEAIRWLQEDREDSGRTEAALSAKNEPETLNDDKMAINTTTFDIPEGVLQADAIQKILMEHRKCWEAEKDEYVQKILEEESTKHNEMKTNLEREHEESINKIKSRQMAEIQVSFNEAIHSVTKEKDSVIEALRSKVSALQGNLLAIQLHLEDFSGMSGEVLLSQSDSGAASCLKGMAALEKLRSDIKPFLHVTDNQASLQDDAKHAEQFKKIKLSCRAKQSPCIDCIFKISILSCNEGDLILLCYEEKNESFVVFHFGQFLHFLHTDSLQPLGLKIPADPSDRWALGVVTSKEFCVARKPSNRYKINLGAKFYRVKVKPWEREKAQRCYQLQRSQRAQISPSEGESSKGMSASSF